MSNWLKESIDNGVRIEVSPHINDGQVMRSSGIPDIIYMSPKTYSDLMQEIEIDKINKENDRLIKEFLES